MDKALLRVWIDKKKLSQLHAVKKQTGLTMAHLVNETIDYILKREVKKVAKKAEKALEMLKKRG